MGLLPICYLNQRDKENFQKTLQERDLISEEAAKTDLGTDYMEWWDFYTRIFKLTFASENDGDFMECTKELTKLK